MKMLLIALCLVAALGLSACAGDSQHQYSEGDVGKQVEVEFGTIIAVKDVKIQGKDTGLGLYSGAAAGAGAGNAVSYGQGHGNAAGVIGGMIVGGIAGAVVEHKLQNRKGIEYTITKKSGKTVTIVQNVAKDDVPLARGQRVMIQITGDYMRVLPADDMPTKIKKPKDISVDG